MGWEGKEGAELGGVGGGGGGRSPNAVSLHPRFEDEKYLELEWDRVRSGGRGFLRRESAYWTDFCHNVTPLLVAHKTSVGRFLSDNTYQVPNSYPP